MKLQRKWLHLSVKLIDNCVLFSPDFLTSGTTARKYTLRSLIGKLHTLHNYSDLNFNSLIL